MMVPADDAAAVPSYPLSSSAPSSASHYLSRLEERAGLVANWMRQAMLLLLVLLSEGGSAVRTTSAMAHWMRQTTVLTVSLLLLLLLLLLHRFLLEVASYRLPRRCLQ